MLRRRTIWPSTTSISPVVSQCGPPADVPCFFTAFPDEFNWLLVDTKVRTDVAGAHANASVDLSERASFATASQPGGFDLVEGWARCKPMSPARRERYASCSK